MIIKKSDIQSIIVTKEREFKHRSITFLNNIAFNAEKVSVDNISEAAAQIEQNPKILNLLIDGKDFFSLLEANSDELKKICSKPELIAMMYIDRPIPEEAIKKIGLSNLYVKRVPFEKGHFNDAFHNRGGKATTGVFGQSGGQEGSNLGMSHAGLAAAPAAKPNAPKKNLTAFEATAHVRDTIPMLNIIDKNRSALEQVFKIGQIFNGLVGAFAYFSKKDGFQEMRNLAIVVDEISRYHEKNKPEKISDAHYELLYNSVRSSFLILQALRDNQSPDSELLEKARKQHDIYLKTDELEKRDMVDQGEIDQLLENLK